MAHQQADVTKKLKHFFKKTFYLTYLPQSELAINLYSVACLTNFIYEKGSRLQAHFKKLIQYYCIPRDALII